MSLTAALVNSVIDVARVGNLAEVAAFQFDFTELSLSSIPIEMTGSRLDFAILNDRGPDALPSSHLDLVAFETPVGSGEAGTDGGRDKLRKVWDELFEFWDELDHTFSRDGVADDDTNAIAPDDNGIARLACFE